MRKRILIIALVVFALALVPTAFGVRAIANHKGVKCNDEGRELQIGDIWETRWNDKGELLPCESAPPMNDEQADIFRRAGVPVHRVEGGWQIGPE